jgi:hypothetical protein
MRLSPAKFGITPEITQKGLDLKRHGDQADK